MNAFSKNSGGRKRGSKNQYVTKNGNVFKIHRNLSERWVARRDAIERRRAERKASLPKDRIKRFLYHFKPSRMYHYWFSRDGGVMALKIVGISFVIGFILLLGVFAYFRKDLPSITDVSNGNIGGSVRYYDRTGKVLLWEDYDAVKRIPVHTSEINNYVRDATVAVEDKDFFKHGGFDVRGIMRAGINDVFGHGATQGGSTITQQLVKLNLDWTQSRTLTRKVKEVILAVELERSYSKNDILTFYLNAAPYGNIEYGVEAASRDYFHKSAKDLTLDEAAFLAAIPKSPSIYSPYGPYFDKATLVGRQQYILDLMVQQGFITKAQADAAKKVDVIAKIHPQETKYAGIKAPYFVLAAKSQLETDYGTQTVNRGGWQVLTTVDLKLQDLAEKLVKANLPNVQAHGGDEEAFVAEDIKTGQIVAEVGGVDFSNKDHGKINYAHNAFISPGSSFKPYDYSALIETSNNVGAGSVLYDKVGPLPGYPCSGAGACLTDFDKRSPGPLTLRYALGGSRNIPAVKANLIVGTDKVIKIATDMMANTSDIQNNRMSYNCYSDVNLTKTSQCYGASAIGDGAFLHLDDHVNGLATLARMGTAMPRTYILKITKADNKELKLTDRKSKQVLRPDTAYILNDMASDPRASYFGYGGFHRYKGWKFAIKTGTTNNAYDGLMTSWSTQYAAVTWVGYHTRTVALVPPMENITMPMIRPWMEQAHDMLRIKPVNWQKPSGVKTLPAFVVRSHVGYGSIEPSPTTDLFPSWYVPNTKQASANKPIDKVSGKLATDCTPELAKQTGTNANSNLFSIDIFVTGASSANITQTDDVHKCDDERPSISITSTPGSCQVGSSCSITVVVGKGTHPLSSSKYRGTVNVMIDGKTVKSVSVDNAGSVPITFTYNGSSGSHSLKAQIVDSVLYDDTTDSVPINFTGASSPVVFISAKRSSSVTVKWSGGVSPFTLTDSSTSLHKVCSSSPCTVTLAQAPLSSTIIITDDDGNSASGSVTN